MQSIDLQAGNAGASCSTTTLDGAAFFPVKDNKPPQKVSKYCIMLSLAAIITTLLIAITLTMSVISVTANSKITFDVTTLRSEVMLLHGQDETDDYFAEHNLEELHQLRLNLTQLRSDFQQLRDELKCPSFISSCYSLHPDCPSDYYWVRAFNGSVVRVYSDMTISCGNITGGWMRVAELNMTDTSQQCPSNLVEKNNNVRRCETMNVNCSTTNYSALNIRYREVCGRITAYQVGTTNAFKKYIDNKNITFINSTYVDGVSLTHGNPREHIWTFAAALDRNDSLRVLGIATGCDF